MWGSGERERGVSGDANDLQTTRNSRLLLLTICGEMTIIAKELH